MKKIVLLAVLSLSLFSVACGSDASTCEEAYENIKDACEGEKGVMLSPKEESVSACDSSATKEEQIECSNEANCGEILSCNLNLAFGG